MIAPTELYKNVPTLAPEEAADLVAQACIFKPVRIATRLGMAGQVMHALMPCVAQIAMNTAFRMFPDSPGAKGDKGEKAKLSPEALAIQQMCGGFTFKRTVWRLAQGLSQPLTSSMTSVLGPPASACSRTLDIR